MRKLALVALFISLLLTGCGRPDTQGPNSPSSTPSPSVQATPTRQAEGTPLSALANGCHLLDSQEAASASPDLTRPEINRPIFKSQQADHPIFSGESLPVKEVSCLYYIYYMANYANNQMTQVTYWLDLPGEGPSKKAEQVWADAKSHATQQVAGVGDDAFYDSGHNGRLTFKKGDAFVTIEVLGTKVDTSTQAGRNKQIEMEKNMALIALTRFQ